MRKIIAKRTNRLFRFNTVLSLDGTVDAEINYRIQKIIQICYQMIGKKIKETIQMRFYISMYITVLLYESESWTILNKHLSRIPAAVMGYMRKMYFISRHHRRPIQ